MSESVIEIYMSHKQFLGRAAQFEYLRFKGFKGLGTLPRASRACATDMFLDVKSLHGFLTCIWSHSFVILRVHDVIKNIPSCSTCS